MSNAEGTVEWLSEVKSPTGPLKDVWVCDVGVSMACYRLEERSEGCSCSPAIWCGISIIQLGHPRRLSRATGP